MTDHAGLSDATDDTQTWVIGTSKIPYGKMMLHGHLVSAMFPPHTAIASHLQEQVEAYCFPMEEQQIPWYFERAKEISNTSLRLCDGHSAAT